MNTSDRSGLERLRNFVCTYRETQTNSQEIDDDEERSAVKPKKAAKAKKKEVAYNPFNDFHGGANDGEGEFSQGANEDYNPFADFMDGVKRPGIKLSYHSE